MRLGRLPRHAEVTTVCRGQGCPLRASEATARKLGRLLTALDGLVYRAGDRISITIRAPGYRPERAVLVIRNGAEPTAKLL